MFRALSKAKKLTEEQVGNTLPAVEQFSFSANRASDWVILDHPNNSPTSSQRTNTIVNQAFGTQATDPSIKLKWISIIPS